MRKINSFQIALFAVLPMFLILVLGFFLRKLGITDKPMLSKLNTLCFKVFLALNIYYNIYTAKLSEAFSLKLLTFAIASQIVVMGIGIFAASLSEHTPKRKGALSHGILHSNVVIFGTLIGTALCGEGNLGACSLVIAVTAPVQNVLSVVLLEMYREKRKHNALTILLGVLKNPYVIAAALGFATKLLHITLPSVLGNTVRDLSRCGAPVALIAMGGMLNFGSLRGNIKPLIVGASFRLLIVPALLISAAVLLGFRGLELVALMCVFIAPCATSSFNLASEMDSDADLASQLVVFTSVLCILTVFAWIFALSRLALV